MSNNVQASEQSTEKCDYCDDDFPEGELTTTADCSEACDGCLRGSDCYNCNSPLATDDGSIYDADGDWWCESCADMNISWCESCEEYISNEGTQVVDGDTLCDDCCSDRAHYCDGCDEYHYDDNRCGGDKEHIRDTVRGWTTTEGAVPGSVVHRYRDIRGSLMAPPADAESTAEWVYGDALHNHDHGVRYLPRNAGSVGAVDGWFKAPLEVESPLHREVSNTLYWAVRSATDHTIHHSRQDADYHPFRELFRFAFTSEREAHRWTFRPGSTVASGCLQRSRIEQAVRDNRLPDGSKLTRKVSRLFARYRKHPDHPGDDTAQSANWPVEFSTIRWSPSKNKEHTRYDQVWATFLTNACYLKVVGQLGWDTTALKDLVQHAGQVNSCQARSHNEGYAFGAASLLCNDYRILFFRNADTDEIVARSVVRYYRHGRWVMVAPSRLYLSEGNSSESYHLATFDLLARFCEAANKREAKKQQRDSHGRFVQKLVWLPVAYKETSHSGGDSITSHLMATGSGKYTSRSVSDIIGDTGRVWTEYCPTYWLEKPGDECADYHYYANDENIDMEYLKMKGGDGSVEQGSFQYVIRAGTRATNLTAYTPIGG